MKGKHILSLAIAVFMLTTLFTALPRTKGFDGQIKIGIIGPVGLPHWSPGMKEAAEMARDEINGAGGINIGGSMYEIVLAFGNEYAVPVPNPAQAAAEMDRLCDPAQENCDFIIGGFRTECVVAMIPVARSYGTPFWICGASTDELLTTTVGADHDANKYLFRVTPINSTQLFYTIAGALRYYLIPTKLLPLYGHDLDSNPATPPQVRTAVLMEDLNWTQTMYFYLTNPAIYPSVLGPNVNVTYAARVPATTTDFSSYLTNVQASGARLLIHVFSATAGVPLIIQWSAMNISALPVGINVMAQLQTHWTTTGGGCEYESLLNFAGTRTPIIPGVTEVFWDNFMTRTGGAWPLYTAWGAYDQIYGLKEAMEAIDSQDKDALHDYFHSASYERTALNGKFKYTSIHDVFSNEPGPVWLQGYVRSMIVQWLAGRMEVVSPYDKIYSKKWAIPPWMYPLKEDINYDGKVDMKDVGTAAKAFGTYPGAPRWEKEADMNFDDKVDMKDISQVARKFGTTITLPLP